MSADNDDKIIDTSITQADVDNAIKTLDQALDKYKITKRKKISDLIQSFKKLKDRRTGKERRQNILAPYFRAFIKKMLENFCSAKMLMFFLPLWASMFFLYILFGMHDEYLKFVETYPESAQDVNLFFQIAMNGFISWCAFTVSLGGTIIVVRENFKVQKLKALNEGDIETNDDIMEVQD